MVAGAENAKKRQSRCGDHEAAAYLAQVNAMKRLFARLAAAE
jgi:hypothetical protein